MVVGGGGVLAGEMAMGFAGAGARVVVADLNLAKAKTRAEAIRAAGGQAMAVACDATVKSALLDVRQRAVAEFGGVEILLNAAGVNSGTPFLEITEAEWQKLLDINLRSVFLACQVFGELMVQAGNGGAIINISSASSGPPLSKVFTYGVAKAGVNQITQFLAREWAPYRVRVNALLPGFFPAEQNRKLLTPERTAQILNHTPMGRFGDARELVAAAIFLASENAASFVTGAILRVDGGFGAMTI